MKKSSAMDRLLEEGFFDSREAALPYLMSGAVYCGAQPVSNGGQLVPLDKPMTVRGLYDRYVGKGGYKLEGAIRDFGIAVEGRVCIDAGACTGGFTDCLVKHGAALVYAVEAGFGQRGRVSIPRTRGLVNRGAHRTWAMKSCFRSILFLAGQCGFELSVPW